MGQLSHTSRAGLTFLNTVASHLWSGWGKENLSSCYVWLAHGRLITPHQGSCVNALESVLSKPFPSRHCTHRPVYGDGGSESVWNGVLDMVPRRTTNPKPSVLVENTWTTNMCPQEGGRKVLEAGVIEAVDPELGTGRRRSLLPKPGDRLDGTSPPMSDRPADGGLESCFAERMSGETDGPRWNQAGCRLLKEPQKSLGLRPGPET